MSFNLPFNIQRNLKKCHESDQLRAERRDYKPHHYKNFIIRTYGVDGVGARVGVSRGLGVLVGWGWVGWGVLVGGGWVGGDVAGGWVGLGLSRSLVGVGVLGRTVRTGAGVDVLVAVVVGVAFGVGVKASSAQCPGPVTPVL